MSTGGCDTPKPTEGLAGVTEGPVMGLCPAARAGWLAQQPALSPAGCKPPGWGVAGAELHSWTQMLLAPLLPSGLGLPGPISPRYDGHQKVTNRNSFFLPLLLKCLCGSPSIAAAAGRCSLSAAHPSRVPAAVRPTGGCGPAGSVEPGSAGDFTVPPPSAVNSSWTAAEETSGLGFSSICKNALLHLPNACECLIQNKTRPSRPGSTRAGSCQGAQRPRGLAPALCVVPGRAGGRRGRCQSGDNSFSVLDVQVPVLCGAGCGGEGWAAQGAWPPAAPLLLLAAPWPVAAWPVAQQRHVLGAHWCPTVRDAVPAPPRTRRLRDGGARPLPRSPRGG